MNKIITEINHPHQPVSVRKHGYLTSSELKHNTELEQNNDQLRVYNIYMIDAIGNLYVQIVRIQVLLVRYHQRNRIFKLKMLGRQI